MEKKFLEKYLSIARLQPYNYLFDNDSEKAIKYYQLNMQLSSSLYPIVAITEIALRNTIDFSCSGYFNCSDWLIKLQFPYLNNKIRLIISDSSIQVNKNDLITSLPFGFWTSLFNKQYAFVLWKPLLNCFPYIERENRNRKIVAYKLDQIRKFRNRIFHHEPIGNNLSILRLNYQHSIDVLNWIDPGIVIWLNQINEFEDRYHEALSLKLMQ